MELHPATKIWIVPKTWTIVRMIIIMTTMVVHVDKRVGGFKSVSAFHPSRQIIHQAYLSAKSHVLMAAPRITHALLGIAAKGNQWTIGAYASSICGT